MVFSPFFGQNRSIFQRSKCSRIVTVNLANGMAKFGCWFADGVVVPKRLSQLVHFPNGAALGFLFAPHIFRDLDVVNRVIDRLPDRMRRAGRVNPMARRRGSMDGFNLPQRPMFVSGRDFRQYCRLAAGSKLSVWYATRDFGSLRRSGQPDRCIGGAKPDLHSSWIGSQAHERSRRCIFRNPQRT